MNNFQRAIFSSGTITLLTVLLAQVAHEQDVYDDGPGDGDSRPDDQARHIGHADVAENNANGNADTDRHCRKESNCHGAVSHFFSPPLEACSKQRATSSPFGNFERKVNINYINIRTKSQIFRKITLCFCNFTCIKRRQIQLVILYEFVSFIFLTFCSALTLQLAKQQHSQSRQVLTRRRFGA